MADHHQYGLADLSQLVTGKINFHGTQEPTDHPFFIPTSNLAHPPSHHSDSVMVGEVMLPSGLLKLSREGYGSTSIASATSSLCGGGGGGGGALYGVEMDAGWITTDSGNNSRWPRQETLTLLEIRSRLDSKFKEANQKGPLWDEVSRIMGEEHGYQRIGKKCREKFENLYKYYKKTKEGKAGRQDGKHYRFFRQLEALCGETSVHVTGPEIHFANNSGLLLHQPPNASNINQENQESHIETNKSDSLSFSNTSDFETSSSENNDDELSAVACCMVKQKGMGDSQACFMPTRKRWKLKVKEFVDGQMKKLLDNQEMWMEKMLKTMEDQEMERTRREEEWMNRERARFDQEREFWAKERAWIEARDVALIEALKKCTAKGTDNPVPSSSSMDEQIFMETSPSCDHDGPHRDSKVAMDMSNYFQQLDSYNNDREEAAIKHSHGTLSSFCNSHVHGSCFQVPINE